MGSSLSIVNDTPNPWMCATGAKDASINIASIALTAVATNAVHFVSPGSLDPLTALFDPNGVVSMYGVSSTAVAASTTDAGAAALFATIATSPSPFGIAVANDVKDLLDTSGYKLIPVGETVSWGKMSTSIWQQAICIKTVIMNVTSVRIETMHMRPIYSGNAHSIQTWLNEQETEKLELVVHTGEPTPHRGTMKKAIEPYTPKRSDDRGNRQLRQAYDQPRANNH